MRALFLFFSIFLSIYGFANDGHKFPDLIAEGQRQYHKLLEFNASNENAGRPSDNWYIFSLLPEQDWLERQRTSQQNELANGIWVDEVGNGISASVLTQLNQDLQDFNSSNDVGAQLYICVTSGIKFVIPSDITLDLTGFTANANQIYNYLQENPGAGNTSGLVYVQEQYQELLQGLRNTMGAILNSPIGQKYEIPVDSNRVVYGLNLFEYAYKSASGDNVFLGEYFYERVMHPQENSYFVDNCSISLGEFFNLDPYRNSITSENFVEWRCSHAVNTLRSYVAGDYCHDYECNFLIIGDSISYAPFAAHPYLQSESPLKTAILNNPCLLLKMEHHEWQYYNNSEWMEGLNNICGKLLAFGFSPVVMASMAPAAADILAGFAEIVGSQVANATGNAIVDMALQTVINYYFPPEGDPSWTEAATKVNLYAAMGTWIESYANTPPILSAAIQCVIAGNWDVNGNAQAAFDGAACARAAVFAIVIGGGLNSFSWAIKHLKKVPDKVLIKGTKELLDDLDLNVNALDGYSINCNLNSCGSAFFPQLLISGSAACATWKIIQAKYQGFPNQAQLADMLDISDASAIHAKMVNDPAFRQDFFESGLFARLVDNEGELVMSEGSRQKLLNYFTNADQGADILRLFKDNQEIVDIFVKAESQLDQLFDNGGITRIKALFDDLDGDEGLIGAFKGNAGLVEAWENLHVRNVPDALRTNKEFLTRLSNNANLINYVDNLTDAGKSSLATNVDEWLKLYDVRVPLKNGDDNGAVNVLEGILRAPEVYNGKKYVGPLESYIGRTPEQVAELFENIVNSTVDVAQVSNNLGISINVVQTMKQHLFANEHLVEVSSGTFVKGRFNTYEGNADLWNKVAAGNFSNTEATNLKQLISHEYIEAKLMQEGMLYARFNPGSTGPTSFRYGAHDLSSHEQYFNFNHWGFFERNVPLFSLNSNLDNIDEVITQIKNIEGL